MGLSQPARLGNSLSRSRAFSRPLPARDQPAIAARYRSLARTLRTPPANSFTHLAFHQNRFSAFAPGFKTHVRSVRQSGRTYRQAGFRKLTFYAAGGLAVEYAGQDQYGRGNKWLVLASQEPGKVINVYNGAYLSEGGAWTDRSDRNAKENFEPVNPAEILDKVASLPLSSWSYRSESHAARHLGPVAQDFHAAFGLGADDKHIAGLDSSGVALAAIQGLSQELKAKQAEIDQLKQRLEALEMRLDARAR